MSRAAAAGSSTIRLSQGKETDATEAGRVASITEEK
jgi:hypothetical protein